MSKKDRTPIDELNDLTGGLPDSEPEPAIEPAPVSEPFELDPADLVAVDEPIPDVSVEPEAEEPPAHPHVHEPGPTIDNTPALMDPSQAMPNAELLNDAPALIEVLFGYRGKLTREQFLAPGVYAWGDPALRGLETELIARGAARKV